MNTLEAALAAAAVASLLIGFIEIKVASRADVAAFANLLFVGYLGLLVIGNIATTSLASRMFLSSPAAAVDASGTAGAGPLTEAQPGANGAPKVVEAGAGALSALPGAPWFWCAFLGVFGFEALLKRLNVTVFDQGVLTINDWIAKARDAATADAIKGQANRDNLRLQSTANMLCDYMDEGDLFAQVMAAIGHPRVEELRASAKAQNANECLSLALAFATEKPVAARAAADAARAAKARK